MKAGDSRDIGGKKKRRAWMEEKQCQTLVDLKGPSTLISGGEGGWNQLEYNPKMDLNFGPYSAPEYTRVHWMHWSVMEYT